MIKVTYNGANEVISKEFDGYEFYVYNKNFLRCWNLKETLIIGFDDIVKLEKKVKHLTLEECKKLFGKQTKYGDVDIYNDNHIWYFNKRQTNIFFCFDDETYIDITSLI